MSNTKECPHKASCALFPLLRLRATLRYWTEKYCDGDPSMCKRLEWMREGRAPPANLLPNGKEVQVSQSPKPADRTKK